MPSVPRRCFFEQYQLFEQYQNSLGQKCQLVLIENYPIPSAKEDLTEFVLLASQQVKAIVNSQNMQKDRLMAAWKKKLELVRQEARVSFGGDAKGYLRLSETITGVITS